LYMIETYKLANTPVTEESLGKPSQLAMGTVMVAAVLISFLLLNCTY
jgi:hypothetical protein